jgi:hypothetical protein
MNKLFHIAKEIRKVKRSQERLNESDDFQVFLDYSREDGKEDLRLLTIIKNLPKSLAQEMRRKER